MPHPPPAEPQRGPIEELLDLLDAGPTGLTRTEAADRLRHQGRNLIPEPERARIWLRIIRHLAHPFALLLWAGAALAWVGERFSPGEGMILICWALVAVVVINGLFGLWQETRVERAMAAFRRMLSPRARVLRDGAEADIDAADLVPGDIILVREGDRVPADARLLDARGLKVDNSPLTGECEPQLRSPTASAATRLDSRNLIFCGTMVSAGAGTGVVYATGDGTELGHIAGVVRATERMETPIRRELRHFIRVISTIAVSLGVVFFAAGWIIGNPFWTNLVFAIGIIVANVPEGMLPTTTLALAIAGRKMARRNALLKSLEAAETLGGVTVICTDKTGTLTCNQMRVTAVLPGLADQAPQTSAAALRIMALCNNASLPPGAAPRGDPTEVALLLHIEATEPGETERLRGRHPRVHERPFEAASREMATIHRAGAGLEALLKGAPEVVVARCSRVDGGARSLPLEPEQARAFLAAAGDRAATGERVLALAHKPVAEGGDLEAASAGGDYQLVGLVAMRDPPRPEVAGAVRRCQEAGVRIIVVSGDHPLTVEAIAREVGICGDAPRVCTGAKLARLGDAAMRRLVAVPEILFARTSPLDKLRIVTALQEIEQVVAVTGDGVNDAPALKRADIGIAMGESGTDVAREAADMVLMDDNFATITGAIEEGRVIYGNIRRFVGYVLTSNVPEILPYVAYVLLGLPLALPVLLVLAIDLGTDMAPAIGLATEPAETDVMKQPPRPRSDRLLSRRLLLSSYLLWGLLESAAGFTAFGWVLWQGGWRPGMELAAGAPLYGQAIAAYFVAVVLSQVANVMIWRTSRESVFTRGLLSNRAVAAGIAVEVALAAMIVHTGPGQELFGTAGLPVEGWLVPVPFAVAMLLLAELAKRRARAGPACASPPGRPAAARGSRKPFTRSHPIRGRAWR